MKHSFKDETYVNYTSFSIYLMNSILNTDSRINELKYIVNSGYIKKEYKKEILKRIERLIETRMNLSYSLLDVQKLAGAEIVYSDIKRTI